jgi:hypothetical protein
MSVRRDEEAINVQLNMQKVRSAAKGITHPTGLVVSDLPATNQGQERKQRGG